LHSLRLRTAGDASATFTALAAYPRLRGRRRGHSRFVSIWNDGRTKLRRRYDAASSVARRVAVNTMLTLRNMANRRQRASCGGTNKLRLSTRMLLWRGGTYAPGLGVWRRLPGSAAGGGRVFCARCFALGLWLAHAFIPSSGGFLCPSLQRRRRRRRRSSLGAYLPSTAGGGLFARCAFRRCLRSAYARATLPFSCQHLPSIARAMHLPFFCACLCLLAGVFVFVLAGSASLLTWLRGCFCLLSLFPLL